MKSLMAPAALFVLLFVASCIPLSTQNALPSSTPIFGIAPISLIPTATGEVTLTPAPPTPGMTATKTEAPTETFAPIEISVNPENPTPITIDDVLSGRLAKSEHDAYDKGIIKNFPKGTPAAGPLIIAGDHILQFDPYATKGVHTLPVEERPYLSDWNIVKNPFNDGKSTFIFSYAIPVGEDEVRFAHFWMYNASPDYLKKFFAVVQEGDSFPMPMLNVPNSEPKPEQIYTYEQKSPKDLLLDWKNGKGFSAELENIVLAYAGFGQW